MASSKSKAAPEVYMSNKALKRAEAEAVWARETPPRKAEYVHSSAFYLSAVSCSTSY